MISEFNEQFRRRNRRDLILSIFFKSVDELRQYLHEQKNLDLDGDHPVIEDNIVEKAIDDFWALLNYASSENYELKDILRKASSLDEPGDEDRPVKFICTLDEIKKHAFKIKDARQKVERELGL